MSVLNGRRLSDALLSAAARRLRGSKADWADAMLAEAEICAPGVARLRWALGCWVASLRLSADPGTAL